MDRYKAHELPETYKRCKTFTDSFSEWLLKTAISRGLEVQKKQENDTGSRHKDKQGKRKNKHKIPLEQLVPLAEGITKTGIPLQDRSGLNDLADAIRTRKEVTEFYRLNALSDDKHPYFTGILQEVKDIFMNFFSSFKDHDIVDETAPSIVVITTPTQPSSFFDEIESEDENTVQGSFQTIINNAKTVPPSGQPSKTTAKPSRHLTRNEIILEQNFQILCLIYDFNRLRQLLRDAWTEYIEAKLTIITVTLITDMALATIQRSVDALLLDLQEEDCERSLIDIIKEVHKIMVPALSASGNVEPEEHSFKPRNSITLQDNIMCMEAVWHLEEYQRQKSGSNKPAPPTQPDEPDSASLPFMPFLHFFQRFRTKALSPPIMDHFTKAMVQSKTGSEPFLVFGLQVVIDIWEIMERSVREVYTDIIHGCMGLSDLMKFHIEYEDEMWDAGRKPDYMSVGETKFSNCFLQPATDLMAWLTGNLEDPSGTKRTDKTIGACAFLATYPVHGGLVLYHFDKIYRSFSISKTQWFLVALSHLYNAARQVGGLDVTWPDLDFIISTHGTKRIFVGEAPTDPSKFHPRLQIALCNSSRILTRDGVQRGAYGIRPTKSVLAKRGLGVHQPLQEKIRDFYAATQEDRWIAYHNLFAHLLGSSSMDAVSMGDNESIKDLNALFATIAGTLSPSQFKDKSRKTRRKAKEKVKKPDFESRESSQEAALLVMKEELAKQELHTNFDYLAFYRRAFDLVHRIRTEVLYDEPKLLGKIDSKPGSCSNMRLLCQLLQDLKLQPKGPNFEVKGDEVSKDVVAAKQLRKTSAIMKPVLQKEGSIELDHAKHILGRSDPVPKPPPSERTSPTTPEPSDEFIPPPPSTPEPVPPPPPYPPSPESPPKSLPKSPPGFYHRMPVRASTRSRSRVGISHSGTEVTMVRRHKKSRFPGRLVSTRKRYVAFHCYSICSMARFLLGKTFSKTVADALAKLETATTEYFELDEPKVIWEDESDISEAVYSESRECPPH